MLTYRRVTHEDRCQIQAYLGTDISISDVARTLGFHKSTIYRELARNCSGRKYCSKKAQRSCERRYRQCRRPYKIHGELEQAILKLLSYSLSPELIAGRLEYEGYPGLSHQAIYEYIYRNWDELKIFLARYNKRGAGRYRQRKSNLNCEKTRIGKRPKIANNRRRIGDWERDTMYIAKRKLLLVCTDRKSRYTKIGKTNYKIKETSRKTMKMLEGLSVKTITNDNGPEFRDGPNMDVPVYFCNPQRPNERGTVENMIGLLRRYIPRNTKMQSLNRDVLQSIENSVNFRPRKVLDYKTPYEVFYGITVALAV